MGYLGERSIKHDGQRVRVGGMQRRERGWTREMRCEARTRTESYRVHIPIVRAA